jgi:hypothetical protein
VAEDAGLVEVAEETVGVVGGEEDMAIPTEGSAVARVQ